MFEINVYNDFLKDMRSATRFDWSGRLFHSLAPLFEKLFWPLEELFLWYFEVCGSIFQILQGIGRVCDKQINQVLWCKSINLFEDHDL